MVGGRRAGVAHCEVEALVGEVGQPVRQLELDPDGRMATKERLERGRHLLAAERHRGRHAHEPARLPGEVAHVGEAARDLRERLRRVVDQPLPRVGEAHRACRALHQRQAHRTLEIGDALAYRRLAQRQSLRGLREAAGLRDDGEQVHVRPEPGGAVGGHVGANGT